MSTQLSQSSPASFPDRPSQDGVGLEVLMAVGDGGAYLAHDLGSELPGIHARFMLNTKGVDGGSVTLFAGVDGTEEVAFRISFDAGSGGLTVWFADDAELTVSLTPGVSWHCVEIAIDTVADQADLWINGVLAGQLNAGVSGSKVQAVLFGAIHKQADTVGQLYLDEIILSDSYVGPVVVEPQQSHAGDPARWLVVYNTADPDSGAWAESYRQARGVPYANLVGLSLPLTENINASQYASLVGEIEGYLALNRLGDQVMGVLLGYLVPGYIDSIGGGMYESVPAQMQNDSTTLGSVINPHGSPADYTRLTKPDLAGVRMTARIDAPDLSSSKQLADRATAIMASGLSAEQSSFYFDPFIGDDPAYQGAFTDLVNWVVGEGGMKTRLNIQLSGDPNGNEDAGLTSVFGDGIYWGWSLSLPAPGIFVSPSGQRALCGQMYLAGASATTLRNAIPSNWADTPIAAGYASVIASSRDTPLLQMPDARALFDALTLGWTLAEAWFVAQPVIRGGCYLVGDPLMRIGMPLAGTEVYGPMDSLADLDPSAPALILPEGVSHLDLAGNAPADGEHALYVLRRTDELGRAEASPALIRTVAVGGLSLRPPSMPVWPDAEAWSAYEEDSGLRLQACWAGPISAMDVGSVELMSQPEGAAESVLSQPTFDPRDAHVLVVVALPGVRTRYRWRVTSSDGVVMHTPWSKYVEPLSAPNITLQTTGANL